MRLTTTAFVSAASALLVALLVLSSQANALNTGSKTAGEIAGSEKAMQGRLAALSQGLFLEGMTPVGLLFLLASPASCAQFKQTIYLALEPFTENMTTTTAWMTYALHNLQFSRGIAHAEDYWSQYFGRGILFRGLVSYLCYAGGVRAFQSSAFAVKESLAEISREAQALDYLIGGSNYTGAAQGVLKDYEEVILEIEARKPLSKIPSLGERVTKAQEDVSLIWAEFKNNIAPAMITALKEILSSEKTLSEAALFLRKLRKARQSTEGENQALKDSTAKALRASLNEFNRLQQESLEEADAVTFSVAAGGGISSAANITSFAVELRGIALDLKNAGLACERALKNEASKQRGWLGRAVVERRECLAQASKANSTMTATWSRALAFEKALEELVQEKILSVRKKISLLQAREEYAAALAAKELERVFEEGGRERETKLLGLRIAALAREIEGLERVALMAQGGESLREGVSRLKAKLEWLEELVSKARSEGFSVYAEEKLLAQAKASLEGLLSSLASLDKPALAEPASNENYSKALELISFDAKAVEESILGRANKEFEELREKISLLESFAASSFLDYGERLRYSEIRVLFEGKQAWQVLGELRKAREFLEKIEAKARARSKEFLAEYLAANAAVTEHVGLVEFGKESEVRIEVKLYNDLDFGSEGEVVEVVLQAIPGNAVVLHTNAPGAVVRSGKIILPKVEAKASYYLLVGYNATLALLESESEVTDYANERQALKSWLLRFKAVKPVQVAVSKEFVSLAGVGKTFSTEARNGFVAWQSFENGVLRVLVNAGSGANELSIRAFVDSPFEISKNARVSGTLIELGVKAKNKLGTSLIGSQVEVYESLNCVVEEASIVSEGSEASYAVLDGTAVVTFKGNFAAGEEKKAVLYAKCDALEGVAREKIEEAEATLALKDYVEPSVELVKALEQAKLAAKRGKWSEAIEVLTNVTPTLSPMSSEEGKRRELNETIERMMEEASEVRETFALAPDLAPVVSGILDEASALLDEARTLLPKDFVEAEGSVARAAKAFGKIAEVVSREFTSLRGECAKATECRHVEEIASYASRDLFLRDYSKALEKLVSARAEVAEINGDRAAALAAKKAVFEDYEKLRDATNKAIASFNEVFALPEELAKQRIKSVVETTGREAVEKAGKQMKRLDELWAAGQRDANGLCKFDLSYLSSLTQDLDSSRKAIEGSVRDMQDLALRELSLASERQKQFGTVATQLDLEQAKSSLESSKYFTAYVLASSLNHRILGAPSDKGGGDYASIAFGIAGVVILAFLAWLFSRPHGKALKEI